MKRVGHHGVPGRDRRGFVRSGRKEPLPHAPGHPVSEKGRARSFRAWKIGCIEKALGPEPVALLDGQDGRRHSLEVGEVLGVMGVAGGEHIQYARQGGVDPAVAPGPVAALAVGLHKRRVDEGGVPPPEAVHGVIEPGRTLDIARVGVEFVHLTVVVGVARQRAQLGPGGHGHVHRVDPPPVRDRGRGGQDAIKVGLDVGDVGRRGVEVVEVNVALARALVVGVAVRVAPHQAPFVARAPGDRVTDEGGLGVDLVEVHQALEIDGPEPVVARPHGAAGGHRKAGVGELGLEIVVGQVHRADHACGGGQGLGECAFKGRP